MNIEIQVFFGIVTKTKCSISSTKTFIENKIFIKYSPKIFYIKVSFLKCLLPLVYNSDIVML